MDIKVIVKAVGGFCKKNSPWILSALGAGSITGGSILLAKKAKAAKGGIDIAAKVTIEDAHEKAEQASDIKEARSIITKAYGENLWMYVKHYGAPVMLISGGMLSMFAATLIQSKRLAAMSAAYTSLAASYNAYRERVKNAIGEKREDDLFHNTRRNEKGEIVPKDPEDHTGERFSRLFDDGNTSLWSKDGNLNLLSIRGAESSANAILREKGFITLNEVLYELGMKGSREGCILGWRYIRNDPVYGSTYVDLGFGECDANRDRIEEVRRSWNTGVWIDFFPPHSLIDNLPSEHAPRTPEEKLNILRRRKELKENV